MDVRNALREGRKSDARPPLKEKPTACWGQAEAHPPQRIHLCLLVSAGSSFVIAPIWQTEAHSPHEVQELSTLLRRRPKREVSPRSAPKGQRCLHQNLGATMFRKMIPAMTAKVGQVPRKRKTCTER